MNVSRDAAMVLMAMLVHPATAAAQDRWIYDNYPTIGISAFVLNRGEGEILAINCTGGDGTTMQPLALKVGSSKISIQASVAEGTDAATPLFGNMKAARATVIFDDAVAGSVVLRGRDYFMYVEAEGDYCSLGLDRLRRGNSVTVAVSEPVGAGPGPLVFATPQSNVTVQGTADIKAPLDHITFGLRGSTAAIDAMLANCPAAAQAKPCPAP